MANEYGPGEHRVSHAEHAGGPIIISTGPKERLFELVLHETKYMEKTYAGAVYVRVVWKAIVDGEHKYGYSFIVDHMYEDRQREEAFSRFLTEIAMNPHSAFGNDDESRQD